MKKVGYFIILLCSIPGFMQAQEQRGVTAYAKNLVQNALINSIFCIILKI